MLTPEQCRTIDPSLADFSDAELTDIVERLTGLAELALEDWRGLQSSKSRLGVLDSPDESPTMGT